MKLLFISEVLSAPFDEGMKNVAFSLHKSLSRNIELLTVTKHHNDIGNLNVKRIRLDRLFLSNELRKLIRDYSPQGIIYMPETSITFNSFLRGRVLKSFSKRTKVVLFATIRRDYNALERFIIQRFLGPDIMFLYGNFRDWPFKSIKTYTLPLAIDIDSFSIATEDEKVKLRQNYGIPLDRYVLLHVGHVRPTRNVSLLTKVQRLKGVQVLIVDSTSTPQYNELKRMLMDEGIIILDRYIPDISEIYKLADVYVFPVKNEIASINIPLSIIEAMACGLPVITTRFGDIEGYFSEDEGFRYFNTDDELLGLVNEITTNTLLKNIGMANREKITKFTWERLVDEMIRHMYDNGYEAVSEDI